MNFWLNAIINRLETAFRTRFNRKASFVFLNDAHQDSTELVRIMGSKPNQDCKEFLHLFTSTHDLFIEQLLDSYP
ncbi:MAG: hypothetical protein ABF649_18495 [Bacillus sp. (in: firmicutes)]